MSVEDNTEDTRGLSPQFVANKWQPGAASPNPKGRPLGSKNRSTIVKEWLEMSHEGEPNIDRIMRALILKASEGDIPAIKEALDSAFGKITDNQKISGDMNLTWPMPKSKLDE